MLFNPISPLSGGTLDTYRYGNECPVDFEAGLDYTRPANGFSPWPYPQIIGHLNGFIPQFNSQEYALMLGQLPSGPAVNLLMPGVDLSQVFPNLSGGLPKVGG